MHSSDDKSLVTFGVFQVNLAALELRKHGVRVRLSGQPFAILSLLLEKPGEIVTREELQSRLWAADTFVDFEQGLNGAIKKLRDALGDSPEQPRYVETLPRGGYRFIAPVKCGVQETAAPAAATNADSAVSPAAAAPNRDDVFLSRRSRLRIASACAVLVLLVAATVLTLHFRRTPPLLTSKDTIVLSDFENSTSEPVFGEALHQGLVVGMEQSPFFQILSERKSAVILKQMGRAADERIVGRTAIELCQRAGSKAAVQGAISNLGSTYLIALTAYRCDNSESIAHEQVEAHSKEDVLRALGEATTHLRTRLGESISSIQKYNAPLEQATTPSLEALQAYGNALGVGDRQGDRAAIPFYERAIALDPNFAMAYGRLAGIYNNLGETQLARENSSKAFAHKDRTTESEKLQIQCWFNMFETGNLERAAEFLEIWRQNYPPSARILSDLSSIYGNLGRYQKAADLLREAIPLDPGLAIPYANLAACLIALDRSEEADRVLADAARQNLQTEALLLVRYWSAFLRKNSQEMAQIVALSSASPGLNAQILFEEADTAAYFGEFAKSRRLSDSAAAINLRKQDRDSAALVFAIAALREAEIGDSPHARACATRSLQLSENSDTLALTALSSAKIGDLPRAQELAEQLSKSHPEDTLVQKYWLPVIHARIELSQGKIQKALETTDLATPYEFADAPGLTVSALYPDYVRGEIYLAANDFPRAAEEFQKLLDHPGMGLNFPLQSLARLQLARAQGHSGNPADAAKARDSYAAFFQLWRDADPGLALLKQARSESRLLF